MTAPKLKPCPFCGGDASISKDHDQDGSGAFYAVKCRKCRAKSPEIYAVETCNIHFTQVRDAWNRRADLAQPAQVRVKPLVWGWNESLQGWRADCQLTRDVFCVYETNTGWVASSETTGSTIHANADAAKYALDGNRVSRIIAALEPQPDPRDEVIARLVEAATDANQALVDAAEEIAELRLAMSKQDLELPWIGDAIDKLTLSIAAAKAVQL